MQIGATMLGKVEIKNFRSLRSVSVPLRPLTILIGPNDSGKSAFLAALQYLVYQLGIQRWDRWRHDDDGRILLSGTTAQGTGKFSTDDGVSNADILVS